MDDDAYGDRERAGIAGILPVTAATDVVSSEGVGGVDSAALDAPIAAKGVSLRVPPVSAGSRLDVESRRGGPQPSGPHRLGCWISSIRQRGRGCPSLPRQQRAAPPAGPPSGLLLAPGREQLRSPPNPRR